MPSSNRDSSKASNSLCAIYAELIDYELTKSEPDRAKIAEWLAWIKANCHTLATPAGGETPEHLRPFLIQPGEGKGVKGTTVVDGKRIPRVAAMRIKRKQE